MTLNVSSFKLWLVLFSCWLTFAASLTSAQTEEEATEVTAEVGRYQLFQGSYVALDAKNNRADNETSVFRIDTVTGKVDRYV